MEILALVFSHAFYNFVLCLGGICNPLHFPYVPL